MEVRLGRAVFARREHADVRVELSLYRPASGAGFGAELVLVTLRGVQLGTRALQVSGDDCRALDPSLALVLALMLDVPRHSLPQPPPPPPRLRLPTPHHGRWRIEGRAA